MTQDADPDGIQRQRPSLTSTPNHDGMAGFPEQGMPRRPRPDANLRLTGVALLLRRLSVLGIGLILGAAGSLWVAGIMMPTNTSLAERLVTWVYVMGGPIMGTAWGMGDLFAVIPLGWLGLLLIPAHPCYPHPVTACFTLLGLCVWFFAGFCAVMAAVWGA